MDSAASAATCCAPSSKSAARDIEVVAINDLGPVETNAHLLRFDSVHGRFPGKSRSRATPSASATARSRSRAEKDPAKLPWKELGVDIALECTGIFTAKDKASLHLTAGAKRVLVSAPADGADLTVVYGVNHDKLTKDHKVVSNASCTTNCLAPVAKVLNDAVGIDKGFMTTIHSYTGDQPTLDTMHKDLYRARAAALEHDPDLDRRRQGGRPGAAGAQRQARRRRRSACRRRTSRWSTSSSSPRRRPRKDEINDAIKRAAEQQLKGILGFTDEPNVSIDFNHDPHSSIFHMDQTKVMDGTFVRVMSWYDNEWGFSNRMARHRRRDGQADLIRCQPHRRDRMSVVPHPRSGRREGQARAACASTSTCRWRTARSPTPPASSASRRPSPKSPTRAAR